MKFYKSQGPKKDHIKPFLINIIKLKTKINSLLI